MKQKTNRGFAVAIIAMSMLMFCTACNETNKSQKSPVISNTPAAVFMGNSITEGWMKMDEAFFTEHHFISKGISGQTTAQMLSRFATDVIDLKPSVVVILAGINDIAENGGPVTVDNIFKNITAMVELARTNNIKVVVSSVLPAKNFPWRQNINPVEKIIQLNALISNYCSENGIPFIDYYAAMVNSEYGLDVRLAYDGVHPTLAGYKVMEPLVLAAIKKARSQN